MTPAYDILGSRSWQERCRIFMLIISPCEFTRLFALSELPHRGFLVNIDGSHIVSNWMLLVGSDARRRAPGDRI